MVKIKRPKKNVRVRKRPPKGKNWPNFNRLFDERTIDRAEVIPSDDPEESVANELDALRQTIVEEKRRRREEYRTRIDTEFWFVICFQNREQKEEFLKKVGWYKYGDKYLDGLVIAEELGVDIKPIPLTIKRAPKAPKSLRKEVIDNG